MTKEIRVGIGIAIFKQGKVLLGKRKGAHGAGEYAFPGGHMEYGESFTDCVKREVTEECGLEIDNIKFQFVANNLFYWPKHVVHLGLTADWLSGEPKLLEPDKNEGWQWYDINTLPNPLFKLTELFFESYNSEKNYFDMEKPK
ncbi:NUDIX domain-containing protein [Patescibacteria group bacterium]|nr:NUDIX domain-containing protein [Patescibacteria group bacterium]